MLAAHFDFWSSYWRHVAAGLDNRSNPVKWLIEFGSLEKSLGEIHPDTGVANIVAPLKARIEAALAGDYSGLTVVLKIDPSRGLMYAFRGPEKVVRKAQVALAL